MIAICGCFYGPGGLLMVPVGNVGRIWPGGEGRANLGLWAEVHPAGKLQ